MFRIERATADVEVAFSFYVDLRTMQSVRVTEGPDGTYELLEQPVADVIYAGLIEALGIWPDTHPELEPGTPRRPTPTAAIETTLVVMRHTERRDRGAASSRWLDARRGGRLAGRRADERLRALPGAPAACCAFEDR